VTSVFSQFRGLNTADDFMIHQKEKIGDFLTTIRKGDLLFAYSRNQSDVDQYFREVHTSKFTSKAKVNKEFQTVLSYTYLLEDLVKLVKALDSLQAVNPDIGQKPSLTNEFYSRIQNFDETIQAYVNNLDINGCNEKYLLGLSISRFSSDICNGLKYDFDLDESNDEWLTKRFKFWQAKLYDLGISEKDVAGMFLNVKGMLSPMDKPGGGLGLSFGGFSKNKTSPFSTCDHDESFFSPSNWTLIEVDYNYLSAERGANHIIGMSLFNSRWSWFGFPLHVNILQLQHANGTGGNSWFYTPEVGVNWRNFLVTASFPFSFKEGYADNNPNAILPFVIRGTWRIPIKVK
jgi:hypothetical protein